MGSALLRLDPCNYARPTRRGARVHKGERVMAAEPDVKQLLKNSPKNWGKWGPDDEVGSLNYLTPDVV